MFLFLHGLALALGFLLGFGGGSGFTHVTGGAMASGFDGGGLTSLSPLDSGGTMPGTPPGDGPGAGR